MWEDRRELAGNWIKPGQGGCGGHLEASRDRPGLSLRSLQFLFPAGGYKTVTEKTTAAAAAADAGVVFLSTRGHRHKCRSTLTGTGPRR